MVQYIGRRILAMIPTMLIIVIIGFILIELPPGDYLNHYVVQLQSQGYEGAREEAELLRKHYHLDDPVYERFFYWIFRFVQGDFGRSFAYRKPVSELIGNRIAMTMVVSGVSLILAWIISVPIGVYSGTHQYSMGDHFFTVVAFIGVGMPGFVLALIILVAGMKLLGFVPAGLFSPDFESAPWSMAKVVDLLKHLWVPGIIVAVTQTASQMRIMRANLLDVLRMPYLQAARSKGLRESKLTWKYGVRNAIHPLVMNLGMSLPELISSATITGIVLNLPITGPMYLQAIQAQDTYLAGTFLILTTLLLVIGNLLADIALAIVDPRIRYD